MKCADIQALAGNYLDGELPEELCDRIQRHLLRCSACRDEVETVRVALQLLTSAQAQPEPGEAFLQAAFAHLRRELDLSEREPEAPGQLVLGIRE
ncbi:MAG: anti-sigma factor family protein [Armatimonadota bacterium]